MPTNIKIAVFNLNINKLSEIRLRCGQPVIVEYEGEYKYLGSFGLTVNKNSALICENAAEILSKAIGASVYKYTEQLKQGFITVEKGVRIGIAGEYITEGNKVNTINSVTSLNIRISHHIKGCSLSIFDYIMRDRVPCILFFSKPGIGKTTYLRDIAFTLSNKKNKNVLIFDERDEIASFTENGFSFDLGDKVDVIRGANKLYSIINAIRTLKPQVIICDEFYGEKDIEAINFATLCNIPVIASTHICNKEKLKLMPFEYFIELKTIGGEPTIYDKNFNVVCSNSVNDSVGDFIIK